MYSTLDSIDIVITNEAGEKIGVQTDHRSAEEIESEFALSVIFALTRVLGVRRSDMDLHNIRFHHQAEPSSEFLYVLLATGAEVQSDESSTPQSNAEDRDAWQAAAESAFQDLGQQVFERYEVAPTLDGLQAVESHILDALQNAGGKEENEIGYWTAIAELGAATGLVAQQAFGGRWQFDPEFHSTIPFMFFSNVSDNEVNLNAFGKSERFIEQGLSQAPSQLLVQLNDMAASFDQGQVMFGLKPADWSLREMSLCKPLIKNSKEHPEAEMPLVAVVRDMPNTTQTIPHTTSEEEAEALYEQAQTNVKNLEIEATEIDLGVKAIVLQGDYYACEKVLDDDFMRSMHAQLETPLLAVTLPVKGMALISNGAELTCVGTLYAIACGQFQEAPEQDRISKMVFVFEDGMPAGFVATDMFDEILESEEE
ncbi:MAG: hypothetical protein AAF483_20400 [Planctomycetota bacterium]